MDTTPRVLRAAGTAGAAQGITTAGRFIRVLGVAVVLATAVGLTGCGQYSPIGSDRESGSSTGDAGSSGSPTSSEPRRSESPTTAPSPTRTGTADNTDTVSYTWSLPPTDTSVSDNDGPAYSTLKNSCEAAAQYLEDTKDQRSYGFSNPRFAVIFAAGIALCRGDHGEAQDLLGKAISIYTTSGIDRPGEPNKPGTSTEPVDPPRPPGYGEPECDIYRTLRSVLEQVSPDSIPCPGGERPVLATKSYETTEGFDVEVWDDPLTFDVDESLIPPEDAVVSPAPSPTVAPETETGTEADGDPDPDPGATPTPEPSLSPEPEPESSS